MFFFEIVSWIEHFLQKKCGSHKTKGSQYIYDSNLSRLNEMFHGSQTKNQTKYNLLISKSIDSIQSKNSLFFCSLIYEFILSQEKQKKRLWFNHFDIGKQQSTVIYSFFITDQALAQLNFSFFWEFITHINRYYQSKTLQLECV